MDQIIIAFNDKKPEEINNTEGIQMRVNWSALLPHIGEFVRLRPDEIIDGLIVNDTDINVKIGRKKGRKIKV